MVHYCARHVAPERRFLLQITTPVPVAVVSQGISEGMMMGNAGTSVTSGSRPSVRRYLTTGGAIASAGILALSLVGAPSDLDRPRTEVRAVQLAAFTLPPAASPNAILKIFNSNQARLVIRLNQEAGGRNAEVTATGERTPVTVDSPTNNRKAEAAAFDASAAALPLLDPGPLGPFLALLNPGVLLLFGPLILGVILLCLPCALISFLSFIPSYFGIYLPVPALPLAAIATVEETAMVTPTLKIEDALVSDSAFASTATAGPEDATRASETASAGLSAPMLSSEATIDTKIDDLSAVTVTEADEGIEESMNETEATEVEEDSTTDENETRQTQTETARSTNDVDTAETDKVSTGATAATSSGPTAGSASDASSSASSSTDDNSSDGDSSGGESGGS